MDNADNRNRGGMNRVGSSSVLGKPKMVDGRFGGEVLKRSDYGGGMGPANYTRTAKKVPNKGAILSGDAK
jgi:hypothetical protein